MIPSIIDNEPKSNKLDRYTMATALKEIIDSDQPDRLDIATGFFNLKAWQILENYLVRLEFCRLLIGWEVTRGKNAEREIQDWFTRKLEDLPIDDYITTRAYVSSLIAFLERKNPNWPSLPADEQQSHPEWEYATQVRLHLHPHLHSKLYLFPSIAILGSSNFTGAGLTGNTELNSVVLDPAALAHLQGWFEHFFTLPSTIDYRPALLDQLKNSKFGDHPYDPWWVYLKIVFELNKDELRHEEAEEDNVVKLADFQKEGVNRARDIVEQYGGVMIADAVGLGKTFMGLALLRDLSLRAPHRSDLLVVCPAQLKNRWDDDLASAGFSAVTICTQEMMSREALKGKGYDIVLVDESHNFRNNKSKRYQNFTNLLQRRDPKVVLLTATPINTGYMDLYYQLRLMFKGKDTALLDALSIRDMHEFFKGLEKQGVEDIHLVTEQLLVARSRAVIRYRQKVLKQDILLPNGKKIEFPDRKLDTIKYQLIPDADFLEDLGARYFTAEYAASKQRAGVPQDVEDDGESGAEPQEMPAFLAPTQVNPSTLFYEWVFKILQDWQGAPFKVEQFRDVSRLSTDQQEKHNEVVASFRSIVPLMTTTLLKRLESSVWAFMKSIYNQVQFCRFARAAIEQGFIISSSAVAELQRYFANEEGDAEADDDVFDVFESLEQKVTSGLTQDNLREYWTCLQQRLTDTSVSPKKVTIQEIDPREFPAGVLQQINQAIEADESLLMNIYHVASEVHAAQDHKLEMLKGRLRGIFGDAGEERKARKTIVFSFFETTADYLHKTLTEDVALMEELQHPNIAIISGKVARPRRQEIVKCFAPISSEAEAEVTEGAEIDILISTDVLSEGQNLQDAKHVINYDLHWNPVRMIQRAGRIDRLGCIHREVVIHNFFLEDGLEAILNLMRRIVTRLRKIGEAIDLDAPVIEDETTYKKLTRIQEQDAQVIDEYEEQLEFTSLIQSWKDLLAAIKELGSDLLRQIPRGIFSGMLTSDHSGLMVAIEIVKKDMKRPITHWCYEPDDVDAEFPGISFPGGIIRNRVIIERIIKCAKEIPRVVVEKPEQIYERAARIVHKIEDISRQEDDGKKMLPAMEEGNKKYFRRVTRGVKDWGVPEGEAIRFLKFLRKRKLDAIRKDIQGALDLFNETFEHIDEAAKNMLDDTPLNNWRCKTIQEFLGQVYQYFDTNDIFTEREVRHTERGDTKVRLIGVMRLYTKETRDNLTAQAPME